jgi:ribosomal protein S18 acetylase RimI-like enzyme
MAIEVRRATPEDWQAVRGVRLAALQDAPYAFGSSYARERDRPESRWREWIAREPGAVFLAFDDGHPVGMDGVYVDDEGQVRLVAMWVEPASRRSGAGRALTRAVIDWARAASAHQLVLDVTDSNDSAIRLYQALGFRPTGRTRPLSSDPARSTVEMRLPLAPTER